MKAPMLSIVVPCYNEEEVFATTAHELSAVLQKLMKRQLIDSASSLLFVDDGSRDRTWSLIAQESSNNPLVTGVKLARNVGHQNALLAGLETAYKTADCVISIDADLQDDTTVIETFVERYHEGYDVVYGVRNRRDTDTVFKRRTALGYYWFMNKLGIKLVPNHADFRLLSKAALGELLKYKESNLFFRGLVPLVGYAQTEVYYDRKERLAGESKYPLKKMLSFAFDGLTSFSVTPIRFVTLIGFLAFLFSIVAGSYALIQKLTGHPASGWTSLIISIWLLGGLQLMGIGLIGEYVGKIFKEVKARPKYAIEQHIASEPKLQDHKRREVSVTATQP
ncbi:bactoprenol glucosyl transferase [Fictibacillus macauensis ZFHKF-1]|uniref:Bactoprenol glucosyl transferase n=1 Tax=Fictibacillus macauensis ZFHKF-1 TaxID=1196324 RepID=I8AMS7_9BACL|nr:glycosyltransferase family 2 protein [Fictibacillus macauensis]EIT86989.1 bactoprenol glucosyl transferase [Fictibacillus macauensis ZFHKF-1]